MKRWCCAALLLLSGCLMQDPFVRVAPAGEPISAPAWSLYTWKDQGLYRWALLPEHGPTPNLSRARAEARTGLPQLSERLQQLVSGQEIFWNFDVAPISSLQFTLPPAAEQESLCQLMRARGLRLRTAAEMQPVAVCASL